MATTTFLEPGTDATEDTSFFTGVAGDVSSVSAQAFTGLRSLQCNTSSPAVNANCTIPNVLADAGSQISFYFRTDTLPAAASQIIRLIQAGTSTVWTLVLNTNGTLQNTPNGATASTGSTVLSVNTWYRICISYYITNTSTYTFVVYVDRVLDSTTNAGTLTNTTAVSFRVRADSTSGANVKNWFDNIYVATGGANSTSQPDTGDVRITAKRPNANGTTNEFITQIGVGGSGYGSGHSPQVNERPLSTANGWSVINAGSVKTEEYNIENAAAGDIDISGKPLVDYVGWVLASSATGETASIVVNGVSSSISLTSTATLFQKASGSAAYPAGTGTDIGVITDATATTVGLYECGIIVAYLQKRIRDIIGGGRVPCTR